MTNGSYLNRRDLLRATTLSLGALLLPRPGSAQSPINERLAGNLFPVHDPCLVKEGDTYHLFSTGQAADATGLLPWRTSKDLVNWELRGKVFDAIPKWAQEAVPGTVGMWAPDIIHINGEYRLYYSCSTFGSNRSVIGLIANRTLDSASPDFQWEDRGLVIESQRNDDFNAIDSNVLVDREGQHWLTLGSFWSGIKLFPIDARTGKPRPGEKRKYSLASRPVPDKAPAAIEAPFLIERNGYYYLFVSFDYCCRGASSSYYIVAGRSKSVTGPYVGRDGKSMLDGYGTQILRGDRRFRGPGHNAIFREGSNDYLVYHAYDAEHDGRPTLRIAPVDWSDGWPVVSS
ncbi:arabinan endo-1,5-alpha-L-arabinosidase [Povalibacter uvarum]|uniref:Extracellular exo-alpha-(1->5)-L-arabinofuranosidase n=1 Tax=Povalibacter uvarum TaxID=732238 RepID=A0A841HTV6_9GAMM|nr:arabinan endo-1,5-alpha-L-arabinosidase [Povalibacter uvarum]MBB6095422.1 arabinan endo-1,5-alpha-L-arabinosidase [Povalibacter uvarum]